MQTTSPCGLCQRPYSRVHSCPVALQLGMLLIQVRPETDRAAVSSTCDLCDISFMDLGQLYGHLANNHGLTVNDWCPSRDSQGGEGCRHCGLIFESRSGLRRHITEGRCDAFDPLATPHPNDTTAKWGEWLQTGDFSPGALTAHMRLQLTNNCQFCSLTYSRTGDLTAHLLQSHGDLWTGSQPWLRFLLQSVMASRGCQCNPQTHELGITHVCALFRQVAMMIHHHGVQLMVPTQFHKPALEASLLCVQHEVLQQKLIHALTARTFDHLWQDEDILDGLRTRCLTCGGHYTTNVLLHHLLVQHPQTCAWAAQIAFQLHHMLQSLQTNDWQCNLCQQIYNLQVDPAESMTPDRCRLQHQHFTTNCPVVVQLTALLHPLHGRADGPQRPGFDGWSSSTGTTTAWGQKTLGWKRRSSAQASQTSGCRRRTTRVPTGRGHDDDAETDGPTAAESRTLHTAAAPPGLLRFVCPRPTRGHHTASEGAGSELEGASSTTRGRPEVGQFEDPSDGWCGGRTSTPGPAVGGLETHRETLGAGGGERNTAPGRQLAVSTLVSRHEAVEEGLSSTPAHAEAAEESSNAGGTVSVEQSHPEVSQSEGLSVHGTVASSDLASGLRCLVHPPGVVPEYSMVPPRDVSQSPQHGPFEASPAASGDVEQSPDTTRERTRERQVGTEASSTDLSFQDRQRLRQLLLELQLDNPGSSCYANSAFLATVWACLSRHRFQYLDWGARSAVLQAILFDNDGSPFSLEAQDWFPPLVQGWNEHQGQADCAEFGHRFTSWLNVPAISNRWERRVTTSDATLVHDQGDRFMPLTLQLDPAMIADHEISLTALFRLWSMELGMCAGLTDPNDLLLVHIDRMVMSPTGTLYKHDAVITFGWEVQVPILTTTTTLDMQAYTVVAVTAHLGSTQGGHYQTMLRTFPEVSDLAAPSMWMFCDDCRLPQRCWTFPDNFSMGISGLWLCRTTALEMHLATQPRPVESDLMAVLQSQPRLSDDSGTPA